MSTLTSLVTLVSNDTPLLITISTVKLFSSSENDCELSVNPNIGSKQANIQTDFVKLIKLQHMTSLQIQASYHTSMLI